jgi:hypothetical protein
MLAESPLSRAVGVCYSQATNSELVSKLYTDPSRRSFCKLSGWLIRSFLSVINHSRRRRRMMPMSRDFPIPECGSPNGAAHDEQLG